ncbi:MAG: hypothetical protein RLZZ390_698 [Bacteroidota bacterium]
MFRLACILTISLIGFTNLVAQTFTAGASQKNINPDADSLYLAGGKP